MLRNVVLVSSLSILISLTLFQCYRSSYVYLQDPTFFSSTFEDQRWADLPDITACLDPREGNWPAFKSTELSNPNWKKLILDGKQHDFDNVTFSNDWDIVEYWYIRRFETDENYPKITGFRISASHDYKLKEENLILRSHPKFGKCVTLRYSEQNRALGLYYLMARQTNASYPIRYFIHAKNEFWFSTIQTTGIKVEVRTEVQCQVNFEDVKTLDEDSNTKRNCSRQSRDDCFYQYVLQRITCRPPWIDLPMDLCAEPKEAKKADEIIDFALSNLTEICQIPCHFLQIRSGSRNFQNRQDDQTRFLLYFTYKVPILVEKHLMSFLKVIAEIGGTAGLLLGVSFYHSIKMLEYFIHWKLKGKPKSVF